MEQTKSEQKPKRLQWHPALYAGLQIEFEEEADNLIFENEHQLGKKPMEIDVLIIKKETEKPIHKNIGRIFRKYNIVEYKSPTDYLSIDDFYKAYGYTCFYKADTGTTDSVRIKELTITYISESYPEKMMNHLRNERKFVIENVGAGIYYISGDIIPMQVLVQSELSKKENLWLRSLTDKLESREDTEQLVEAYKGKNKNPLYESVMDIIVRANSEKFEEENKMCDALRELMADEFDKRERSAEKRLNDLTVKLAELGRTEDIIKGAKDSEYQKLLFEEFGL